MGKQIRNPGRSARNAARAYAGTEPAHLLPRDVSVITALPTHEAHTAVHGSQGVRDDLVGKLSASAQAARAGREGPVAHRKQAAGHAGLVLQRLAAAGLSFAGSRPEFCSRADHFKEGRNAVLRVFTFLRGRQGHARENKFPVGCDSRIVGWQQQCSTLHHRGGG